MNTIDLIVLAIVGSSIASGAIAGFARSGIGLACAAAGLMFAFWFYQVPAAFLQAFIDSRLLSSAAGFLIVLMPFLIAGAVGGKLVPRLFHWSGLGWLDHLAGAAFGFARGGLVVVALVMALLSFVPKPSPEWIAGSSSLPFILGASSALSELAPQEMKNGFAERMNEAKQLWSDQVQKGRQELQLLQSQEQKR